MQLIGGHFEEARILRAAYAYEQQCADTIYRPTAFGV